MAYATIVDFRKRYPEFVNASDELVQAALDEAEAEIDEEVWDTKTLAGHGFLTAHKLALSPYGQGARLADKDGNTTYNRHYQKLVMQVSPGWARLA